MEPPNDPLPALLALLDEPDDETFEMIRVSILDIGIRAMDSLQQLSELTLNPLVSSRAEQLAAELYQEHWAIEWNQWLTPGGGDLLQGFILLSKRWDPAFNEEKVLTAIERIRMDVWLELNDHLTALEQIRVLNHVLFDVHRFEGDRVNLFAESNQFIDSVLNTRKGSPLTLGMLYLILAQKLHIPVYGVNLPQHFILGYSRSWSPIQQAHQEQMLFYINPYSKGIVFSKEQIDLFLHQMNVAAEPSYYLPCTPLSILYRLASNMMLTYTHLNHQQRVADLTAIKNQIMPHIYPSP